MNTRPPDDEDEKLARLNLGMMRGIQISIIILGGYLAIFDDRGWLSFFVGIGLAFVVQWIMGRR